MLKQLKDEVSSASVEKAFDEIVEMHLENEENNMKHSLKMKQIFGKLESFNDDNNSDSAPDLSEPNTNKKFKVDHIGLPPKNYFNDSSDDLVILVKVFPTIYPNETNDNISKYVLSDIKTLPKSNDASYVKPIIFDILSEEKTVF